MSDWQIRDAGDADTAALALVGAATFLDAYAGVLDGADLVAHVGRVHDAGAIGAALAGGGRAWLAEVRGAPVGYALVERPALPGATEADLELRRIYVLSRFWRLGIGAALLGRAAVFAREAGAARLLLGVHGENERAIGFYRRSGLTVVGTRKFPCRIGPARRLRDGAHAALRRTVMAGWTIAGMPDQADKVVVVTGASSGIGEEAAAALAGRGARVILAVRDAGRGAAARGRILARHPGAAVEVSLLDLADLGSVRDFAGRAPERVDVLLNNAGLGMQPRRAVTVDGFERMFGTNHLGHFALTGLLVPALLRAGAPRVVTIASIAHRRGRIDFDDLQSERSYQGSRVYAQSKLANLMFALELDRRARAAGSRLMSMAAHPGLAATGFVTAIGLPGWQTAIMNASMTLVGQDSAAGARPGLYAATMPDVQGGQYWGPDGVMEFRGAPRLAKIEAQAMDRPAGARLWAVSEELTGVTWPGLEEGRGAAPGPAGGERPQTRIA